jgi:anti-anti-sigma regulatory factor
MLLNELLELCTSIARSGYLLIISCVDERIRVILNLIELDDVFTIVGN